MDEPKIVNENSITANKKQPKPFSDKRFLAYSIISLVLICIANFLTAIEGVLGFLDIFALDPKIFNTVYIILAVQLVIAVISLCFIISYYYHYFKIEEKSTKLRTSFIISVIASIFLAYYFMGVIYMCLSALRDLIL